MITLSCHCGKARVELDRKPDYIHECNCSLCRKSGAQWCYFDPSEVTAFGDFASYVRTDKNTPSARLHFCAQCGSTTHFTLTEEAVAQHGNTMAGVNMRLAPQEALAGIQLRFPDGAAWDGAGEFAYVREAVMLGDE